MEIKLHKILNEIGVDDDFLTKTAYETALIKRQRLIKPADILFATCFEAINGTASFNDIASKIDAIGGESVSRQAVWKKATEPCIDFFKKVLEKCMLNKIEKGGFKNKTKYKRILVQDSTIVKLPFRLFEIFSGVSNGHSKVCNARIQGVYDLIAEEFIEFSIDPYSKNDLKVAANLPIQKYDLTLRDRGYFTVDEIERHIYNQADCIFRYKHRTTILDPVTHNNINILDVLKKENSLDMMVKLGPKSKTPVRIVAYPISEELANNRRHKAKKENKSKPSKEYLELLSWSIYITTVPEEEAEYVTLYKLYSLRWRIEIIFKNWKSNMAFDKIHNVSKIQLDILMLARFIIIIIFSQIIYSTARKMVKEYSKKDLSMIKLTHYLCRNPEQINKLINELVKQPKSTASVIESISKYCTYERRKRTNFVELMYEMMA
jgi:ribosomal silencing factor RsfS